MCLLMFHVVCRPKGRTGTDAFARRVRRKMSGGFGEKLEGDVCIMRIVRLCVRARAGVAMPRSRATALAPARTAKQIIYVFLHIYRFSAPLRWPEVASHFWTSARGLRLFLFPPLAPFFWGVRGGVLYIIESRPDSDQLLAAHRAEYPRRLPRGTLQPYPGLLAPPGQLLGVAETGGFLGRGRVGSSAFRY